jgi:hypothetical protein
MAGFVLIEAPRKFHNLDGLVEVNIFNLRVDIHIDQILESWISAGEPANYSGSSDAKSKMF